MELVAVVAVAVGKLVIFPLVVAARVGIFKNRLPLLESRQKP
jgi:hypothetical protein